MNAEVRQLAFQKPLAESDNTVFTENCDLIRDSMLADSLPENLRQHIITVIGNLALKCAAELVEPEAYRPEKDAESSGPGPKLAIVNPAPMPTRPHKIKTKGLPFVLPEDLADIIGARPPISQVVPGMLDFMYANAKRYKILTAAEEVILARAIEAGVLAGDKLSQTAQGQEPPELADGLRQLVRIGQLAEEHMTCANLNLVLSVMWSRRGRGLSEEDLAQEGNLGLMHAIQMFDFKKGYKFSTYAIGWIRQAMDRALADKSRTIRVPVGKQEQWAALRRARVDLEARGGRNVTVAELAAATDFTVEQVRSILELETTYNKPLPSLDAPLRGDDQNLTLGEIIAQQEKDTDEGRLALRVRAVADRVLTERESQILETAFTHPDMRYSEIARQIKSDGGSDHVVALHKRALTKIKVGVHAEALFDAGILTAREKAVLDLSFGKRRYSDAAIALLLQDGGTSIQNMTITRKNALAKLPDLWSNE